MFLALDESEEHSKKILGGILMPESELPSLEGDFVKLRIQHKLFGEIKWSRIDKYYKKYYDFISLFFDQKSATFHSICYRREKYRAAFVLIRTITWKMQNAGINEPLYVLFDNDGSIGEREVEEIKKIAAGDRKFKQKLEFCNQGTSHVLGILQLADLLTGSVCTSANAISLSPAKKGVADHILKLNNNVPLDWSSISLPKLDEYKIHYFDPDNKPARAVVSV